MKYCGFDGSNKELLQDWMSLGYTESEAIELLEASQWYDPMADISTKEASECLIEAMSKYDAFKDVENMIDTFYAHKHLYDEVRGVKPVYKG